jgi:hypothetical protein
MKALNIAFTPDMFRAFSLTAQESVAGQSSAWPKQKSAPEGALSFVSR